jgi:hypothetical protein
MAEVGRRDIVAAAALVSIGRHIMHLDNEWDDGSDAPSVLSVRRGPGGAVYDAAVEFDDGSKATAIITIIITGAEPAEEKR